MLLEAKDLCASYNSKRNPVLEHADLSVEQGTVVSILGPNGCGKSTLLKVIVQILKPDSGTILFDGADMKKIPPELRAQKIAVLFQKQFLPEEISVEEFVSFGRYPYRRFGYSLSEEDEKLIGRALDLTGITPLRKRLLTHLSGGEIQKVRIAMTLAQDPELLILDEPTTYLDVRSSFELMELIRRLNREEHITVLMVLHDLLSASAYSDWIVMMKDHRTFCSGTPEEVMTKENLRAVFNIETEIRDFYGKRLPLVKGRYCKKS